MHLHICEIENQKQRKTVKENQTTTKFCDSFYLNLLFDMRLRCYLIKIQTLSSLIAMYSFVDAITHIFIVVH